MHGLLITSLICLGINQTLFTGQELTADRFGLSYKQITGSMPANAASKIASIFDTGITFWNNLADTGEYTKNAVGNRGSNYSYDPS